MSRSGKTSRPQNVPVADVDQAALLAWGEADLRDLPWRRSRDPWAVLVSEVMAQQTGVDRVIPYWRAFLDRFPDPAACAAAPVADVLRLWAGLGYNRRGLSLHRCAVAVVEDHGGTVPADLAALLALPGIGPYTARAILAFAYEHPVGVVDTNVGRVLARWAGRPLSNGEAQAWADDLAGLDPPVMAWLWNQTVMELGATVCTKRRPDCTRCPLRSDAGDAGVVGVTGGGCRWHAAGLAGPDPAEGSAGVSRGQSRFEGSDRQGRGRLVDALRRGPVRTVDLARVMGWPDDEPRARRVAATVVADGLAEEVAATLRLPGGAVPAG
jgi:A/G-specific adenine glycosylase